MGFYGTLKLIFFKVSIDDGIDQLIVRLVLVRLVRDDEAFLRRNTSAARARARAGKPLQMSSEQMIDHRSAACACCQKPEQDCDNESKIKGRDFCFDLLRLKRSNMKDQR